MTGIAVNEHQHRVRERAAERVDREHVFGRFQDPASRRLARALEMTGKPRMEPVALVIARRVEPGAIGRGAIYVVEARAAEHVAREFDAFLRRVGLNRMQAPDPGRETSEESELQR